LALRPYDRSRYAEHGGMCVPGVPAPPGVVILAPPEVLRNAEGRKVKAAPKEREKRDPVDQETTPLARR
jgi:hypothetical protein